MAKWSLAKRLIVFGLPIGAGAYLIYLQFKKPKVGDIRDVAPPPKPTASTSVTPTGSGSSSSTSSSSSYPLKKGSKNSAVSTLQAILNACGASPALVVDGDFGAKTETALKARNGKTSVANAAEMTAIQTACNNTSAVASNLDYAWSLVDAYNAFEMNYIYPTKDVEMKEVKKQFNGSWLETGFHFTLEAGESYAFTDYAIRSALTNGQLRIERLGGAWAGMYLIDNPKDITLIQ